MGLDSFGVVGFDLGPLLQGQTKIAKLKSAYNLLIIGPRGSFHLSILVVNAHYLKDKFRFNLSNDGTVISLTVLFTVSRPRLPRR